MRLFFKILVIVLVSPATHCWSSENFFQKSVSSFRFADVKGLSLELRGGEKRFSSSNTKIIEYQKEFISPLHILDFLGIGNPEPFPEFPLLFEKRWGVSFHQITICDLDNDQKMELVYPLSTFSDNVVKVYLVHSNGRVVDGWPIELPGKAEGVACGDVDGDGYQEVILTSVISLERSFLSVIKGSGKLLDHFPIELLGFYQGPSLGDLNGDGKVEIAVASARPNQVTVFQGDGSVLSGWPQPLKDVAASLVSIGDLDGDSIPELVAEDYTYLHAWDRQGNILSGFPFSLPGSQRCSYSSPVIADLNNDGFKEIVFGTHGGMGGNGGGAVFVLDRHGRIVPGWPQFTKFWVYGPPTVGFIDQDHVPDIAVGDVVISSEPVNHLYAWNALGVPLRGFPYGPVNAIQSQIPLVTVDQVAILIFEDSLQELGYGFYHAISSTGNPFPGWPLRTKGSTATRPPALVDFDSDGSLDLVGTSGLMSEADDDDFYLYTWKLGIPVIETNVQVATSQYNSMRNGNVLLQFPPRK